MKKHLPVTIFLLLVFLLAIAFWYSPIIFKGYSTQEIPKQLILARNYSQTGILADQNDLNVTLAPGLVKEQGHPLVLSEYFSSFMYSVIFKITGVPSYNGLILISIILYALVLILFTILVLKLFGFKVAIIFSLIYIFIPFALDTTHYISSYEFCLFFWALFFITYFLGLKRKDKWAILFFIISGVFLALSALSKEVTLVFALALFIFLFFKKKKRELIFIFVPFICLLLIFWLPSVIQGENQYLPMFGAGTEEAVFSHYLHVFPDPYTYHFEREGFLESFRGQDLGLSEDLETKKLLANYDIDKITIFDRFKVGTYILLQHVSRFFSLEEFGGPLLTLLLILGFIYLRNRFKDIYNLSKYWLVISFLVFSYVILVGRSHLMDFTWLFVVLISLGLLYLINIIGNHFEIKGKRKLILTFVIVIFLIYHLLLINHVVLGKRYDRDFIPRSMAYAEIIKNMDIQDEDVIAIPSDFPEQPTTLNYFTNKSFVVFTNQTIDKLLKEEKIKKAFEAFGVKYILGYSSDISKRVITQAEVINITSNSLKVDMDQVSANKSFLMNLIR